VATVSCRIDDQTKEAAEFYFKQIGLTTSTAINIFFRQVVNNRGLPFELRAPTAVHIKDFDRAYPEYQNLIDDISTEYLYE
jgi:DNA-damage-inducible protein J